MFVHRPTIAVGCDDDGGDDVVRNEDDGRLNVAEA